MRERARADLREQVRRRRAARSPPPRRSGPARRASSRRAAIWRYASASSMPRARACQRALAARSERVVGAYLSVIALQDASAARSGIESCKQRDRVDPELGQAWRTLAKAYARAKDKPALDKLAQGLPGEVRRHAAAAVARLPYNRRVSFFRRVFSADYRAAVAAEAAGNVDLAAERYALAGEHDGAVRMHLARAARAPARGRPRSRRCAMRCAGPAMTPELRKQAAKALGRALWESAQRRRHRDRARSREGPRGRRRCSSPATTTRPPARRSRRSAIILGRRERVLGRRARREDGARAREGRRSAIAAARGGRRVRRLRDRDARRPPRRRARRARARDRARPPRPASTAACSISSTPRCSPRARSSSGGAASR